MKCTAVVFAIGCAAATIIILGRRTSDLIEIRSRPLWPNPEQM